MLSRCSICALGRTLSLLFRPKLMPGPHQKKLSQLPEGVLTLVEKMIYRARYMLKKNKIVCISCAI